MAIEALVRGRRAAASIVLVLAIAGGSPAYAADAATPASVEVTAFQVSGNTLVTAEAIERALAPFKGRRTLEELGAAARAVQRLYVDMGYGGVVAYVPPQTRSDGVISLVVVEGRVSAVNVRGAQVFNEANIRASLPDLVVGATPRMRRIDAQMQISNENPSKRVRVLLKPGSGPGETEAEVTVQEGSLRHVTLALDNTGTSGTGEYRASVAWQHANLSGHDDVFTAQFQTSPTQPDRVRVLSAGYRFPRYKQLMVVDAFAAYSDVDGGSVPTAAGDLRFNGNGRIAGVRGTWYLPRVGEADQRVSLGVDNREYLNRCGIAGLPAGACGTAGASVSVQPLSLGYSLQSGGAPAFGLSASLQTNLKLGGRYSDAASFAAVRPDARVRYTALHYGAFASMAVAEAWDLRVRFAGQFSADALVPGEQYGIGGVNSVRGYQEREVLGDQGLLVSVELTGPNLMPLVGPADRVLRIFAFADAGQAFNHFGTPCLGTSARCSLASLGIGSRFEWGRLQARLALAGALRDAVRTRKNDARAHFSVVYTI